MNSKKKCIVAFVLVTLYCGISMADFDKDNQKHFEDVVGEKLPSTWKIVEEKTGVIPHGHYWGQDYHGPKGLSFVLEGDMPVFLHWRDNNGEWHKEWVANESIELWIMPQDYSESWKRFFIIHRPKPAELLFSGKIIRLYAYPSHRIIFPAKFNEILLRAKSSRWPDSPAITGRLSWETWRENIKAAFHGE